MTAPAPAPEILELDRDNAALALIHYTRPQLERVARLCAFLRVAQERLEEGLGWCRRGTCGLPSRDVCDCGDVCKNAAARAEIGWPWPTGPEMEG